MKVRDAMTGDVLTMTPGRSLRDAAKFMADHNVGAVVIMDPEQPGPGIFTERDLVRSIGKGESPDERARVGAPDGPRRVRRHRVGSRGGRRHDGQGWLPPPRRRRGRRALRDHLDARHHAGVATERTSRSVHITRRQDIPTAPPRSSDLRGSAHRRAVAEARRIRGSVTLEPADSRRWSAIVAATDGSLELRVAEPPRRRARWSKETWLAEHGFTRARDCWVLPLDASVGDDEAAARWMRRADRRARARGG